MVLIQSLVVLSITIVYEVRSCENQITKFYSNVPHFRCNLTALTFSHFVKNFEEAFKEIRDPKVNIIKVSSALKVKKDVDLELLLIKLIDYNREINDTRIPPKGLFISFKESSIFESAYRILLFHASKINFPLILNADIAIDDTKPDSFLIKAPTIPNAIVSVGWSKSLHSEYTESEFAAVLVKLSENDIFSYKSVVYNVRASALSRNRDLFKMFQRSFPEMVLLAWGRPRDPIEIHNFREIIKIVGVDHVLLDIDKQEYRKLDLGGIGMGTNTRAYVSLILSVLFVQYLLRVNY